MAGRWVFGYGSLVSPASFGRTLGRELTPGVDFHEAELADHGRRWNYATALRFGEWTFVALGVTPAPGETTNGVIGWVDDDELVELDRRERRYDRVDVTAHTTVYATAAASPNGVGDHQIVTYVPRPEAVNDFEAARDRNAAAITSRYWHLVDAAFAALGEDRRVRYHATTPGPDLPIIDVPAGDLPPRHRVDRS